MVDLQFEWQEVEGVRRVKLLGMPFSGEGARFTIDSRATGERQIILFITFRKRRTHEILDFAEAKGASVVRRASIRFTQP
jgi:hypothetical protein